MVRKYIPKNHYPKLTLDQRSMIVDLKRQQELGVATWNNSSIAREVNCDPKTVRNVWKKRTESKKVTSVKQPGAKRILSDQERDRLWRASQAKPFAFARELRDDPQLFLQRASVPTIKRELRKMGLPAFIPKLKNKLQKHHMTARKTFAENRLTLDWEKVVFSDEKTVQNVYSGRTWVKRPRGQSWNEKYVIRMDRTRRFKVNLWGFISLNQCGLVDIEGKHTGQSYLKILQDVEIGQIADPKKKMIFMQDNAPIHKTKAVTEYLEKQVDVLPWPAYSPDLNPIENIWAEMQKLVHKYMRIGVRIRKKDLFNLCKRCFDQVCQTDKIKKLYFSMEKRLNDVIRLNGKHTKY